MNGHASETSQNGMAAKSQEVSSMGSETWTTPQKQSSDADGASILGQVKKQEAKPVEDDSYKRFTEDEITDALLVSQTSPGLLSGPNAEVLTSLLTHPDPKMKETVLNGINRCSTFTRNQVSQLHCILSLLYRN